MGRAQVKEGERGVGGSLSAATRRGATARATSARERRGENPEIPQSKLHLASRSRSELKRLKTITPRRPQRPPSADRVGFAANARFLPSSLTPTTSPDRSWILDLGRAQQTVLTGVITHPQTMGNGALPPACTRVSPPRRPCRPRFRLPSCSLPGCRYLGPNRHLPFPRQAAQDPSWDRPLPRPPNIVIDLHSPAHDLPLPASGRASNRQPPPPAHPV